MVKGAAEPECCAGQHLDVLSRTHARARVTGWPALDSAECTAVATPARPAASHAQWALTASVSERTVSTARTSTRRSHAHPDAATAGATTIAIPTTCNKFVLAPAHLFGT